MSNLNIQSALALGDRAVIPTLGPVKITKVFLPGPTSKPGAPPHAVLVDPSGETRATLWERQDAQQLEGHVVTISSIKAAGRLAGVSVKEGQKGLEISVSKTAVIVDVEPTEAQTATPRTETAPETTPKAVAPRTGVLARASLEDVIALFGYLYKAADHITPATVTGGTIDPAARLTSVQAAAATLMIAAQKENLLAGFAATQQK